MVWRCSAVIVTIAARNWFGPRAALLAGLAYAVYGPSVYVDTAWLSEGLLVFLLAASLLLMSRPPTLRRMAAAGAALGAAILVRPTAFLFVIAVLVWLIRAADRSARARATMAFAAACAIVVAPAVARNWTMSHTLSLQGYGGVNVYIGDSPRQTGRATFRLGAGWDALNAEAANAGISDPAAQDRYYVRKTLDEIREHPAAFARLLGAKALWLVQAEEVRDSHSFYFFADQAPLLRILPRWAILFPLSIVGAIAIARSRVDIRPLLFHTIASAATVGLFVVGTRYRMPTVPAMAVAAGVGVEALVAAISGRRTIELAIQAAAIVAAVALSHALADPRNRNLAEEWASTGGSLVTEHRLDEAEAAHRRAIDLDPRSSLAWDGLGVAQLDAGRLEQAEQSLSRAVSLDAENARALLHLGILAERRDRKAEAVDRYRAAAALSPYDADVQRRYATALGMAGRSREALDTMRRVVGIDPANGEAWLDSCLLSLDVKDVGAAMAALQRAQEYGASPQRISFAAHAIERAVQK